MKTGLLVVSLLLVCARARADEDFAIARAINHDGVIDLPRGWLTEDPALAADLPASARDVHEAWDAERHTYRFGYAGTDTLKIQTALGKRRATGSGFPLVASTPGITLQAFMSNEEIMFFAAYSRPEKDRAGHLVRLAKSLAPLAAARPILAKLGTPLRVTVDVVATASLEVKVDYALAKVDLAATAKRLIARGFTGNRAQGWLLVPASGPRIIVEVGTEDVHGVEVLTFMAVATK